MDHLIQEERRKIRELRQKLIDAGHSPERQVERAVERGETQELRYWSRPFRDVLLDELKKRGLKEATVSVRAEVYRRHKAAVRKRRSQIEEQRVKRLAELKKMAAWLDRTAKESD